MSTPKRNIYTNQKQYEIMVDFMVKHTDLAKGHLKVPDAKTKSNNMWQKLHSDLNISGPPERDVKGWKKVWTDYKTHVKNKCHRNRNSISGAGGGPSRHYSLTPLEQQVTDLLSIEEFVSGTSGTLGFGVRTPSKTMPPASMSSSPATVLLESRDDIDTDSDSSPQDQRSEVSIPIPPNRSKKGVDRDSLLQKQVETQISYQENSTKILSEINES